MSDPQEILPALFFKEYWKIVRNSVIQAVQSLFTSGKMIKEVNSTLIAFIPKTQNPSEFNHFRPISLCNVVYKIIAKQIVSFSKKKKLIVSRIRPLLHKMISPHQSAFIPGR